MPASTVEWSIMPTGGLISLSVLSTWKFVIPPLSRLFLPPVTGTKYAAGHREKSWKLAQLRWSIMVVSGTFFIFKENVDGMKSPKFSLKWSYTICVSKMWEQLFLLQPEYPDALIAKDPWGWKNCNNVPCRILAVHLVLVSLFDVQREKWKFLNFDV